MKPHSNFVLIINTCGLVLLMKTICKISCIKDGNKSGSEQTNAKGAKVQCYAHIPF
jgi:hypothetical protein